jgi:hypothetical protein
MSIKCSSCFKKKDNILKCKNFKEGDCEKYICRECTRQSCRKCGSVLCYYCFDVLKEVTERKCIDCITNKKRKREIESFEKEWGDILDDVLELKDKIANVYEQIKKKRRVI